MKACADIRVRFLEKVEKLPSGCWKWLAHIDKATGYGMFAMKNEGKWCMELAHRASFQLFAGEIPSGLQLDHKCRNRWCVSPGCLEPVTARENVLRGMSPAAIAARRDECANGHLYTRESTRFVNGARQCRTCQGIWQEKARRRMGKPLGNKFKTHCVSGHPFDEANTYVNKLGRRKCRACRAAGMRNSKSIELQQEALQASASLENVAVTSETN